MNRDVTFDGDELRARVAWLEQVLVEAKRREQTLADSEAWYRGLVDNSNDAIVTFDMTGAVTSLNRAFETLFGWSREELLGRNWHDLVAPEDLPAMEDRARRGFAGEKLPSIFEVRGRHKTGAVIPLEVRTGIMRDGHGAPLGVQGTCRDIGERKRAEAALRESEERYRRVFDSASDLIATFSLDGIITSVNRAFTTLSGLAPEELVGHHYSEFHTKESFARLEEQIRRRRAGEQVPTLLAIDMRCKDGREVPLEGRTRYIRDEAGTPVGLHGVFRDVSERRTAEAALRESEERYRSLFREAEDARQVLDRLYRVTASLQLSWKLEDRVRAFVQGVHDVLGFDRFYVALASRDGATFDVAAAVGVEMFENLPLSPDAGPLYQAFATRRPVTVLSDSDLHAVAPVGRFYRDRAYFRSRRFIVVPLVAGDRAIGVASADNKTTGRPITPASVELFSLLCQQLATALEEARLFHELDERTEQLAVASRHKSEFLANMSHELRTPLNAIIGFSEVLAEGMFGEVNEKQTEYLGDILESGRHLLSLINDILDLSKIEAGRMELETTDFDLPSAIENALILVRERVSRGGITLAQTIDERLGMIRADERKVKQVLLNLLSNALKFTPEGGRIDVRAAVDNGMIEIAVADTGVGIAPEDQKAVFEEFRQVGTAAKKVEGTGLGLALARKFIELHGGRIWVKSQVGVGSTFTFTLPVRRGE
jgi:PAS domain S-box-containing protein